MITLTFLGTLHDDPRGKQRLQTFIQALESQRGTPLAIAFEWAEPTYSALVPTRGELNIHLAHELPQVPPDLRGRLSASLGYEGDFHDNLAAKKIWMLNGYPERDSSLGGSGLVRKTSAVKIANLRGWLLPKIDNWQMMEAEALEAKITSLYLEESHRLSKLDEGEMPEGLAGSIKSGRERFMFDRLRADLDEFQTSEGYALVLVGTAHLLDLPQSLFNLCKVGGFDVERFWPHQQ